MEYLFETELGTGPDGTVRRATVDRLGARPVAARILGLDDDGAVHLRRHAEALAGVGHRHLGLITDVTRIDDGVLVATTLGVETLAERAGRRPLSVDEVLAVVVAVSSALAAAHRAALPHGSVHTGNVVWTAESDIDRPAGVPVLIDLGLSAFRGELPDRVPPSVWRDDRAAMVALAGELIAALGRPATTRAAALAELLGGGDALIEEPDGLATLARECERIGRRPDRPLPVPEQVRPVSRPAPASTTRRPTRQFGPSPAVALSRRPVLAGAALAAGLVVGLAATLGVSGRPGTDDVTPVANTPESDCGPEAAEPTPPPDARPVVGVVDLDADGCADAVWWSPSTATLHVVTDPAVASPDRFRLGSPGDELLVGDWDCDGSTTPGLYRPATGETFRFDAWATAGGPVEASPGPVLAADTTPQVDGSDDGCDRIIVVPGHR